MTTPPPSSSEECEACRSKNAKKLLAGPLGPIGILVRDHHAFIAALRDRLEKAEDVERLASGFHDAWMRWASTLMLNETLSPQRVARWKGLMVPYDQLPENMKEADRKQARLALKSAREKPMGLIHPSTGNGSDVIEPGSASKRADKSPTDAKGEG